MQYSICRARESNGNHCRTIEKQWVPLRNHWGTIGFDCFSIVLQRFLLTCWTIVLMRFWVLEASGAFFSGRSRRDVSKSVVKTRFRAVSTHFVSKTDFTEIHVKTNGVHVSLCIHISTHTRGILYV